MQRTNKKLDFYIIILSVLILAGVILRSVASLLYLDFDYGYYDKHVLITVANWTVGIGCTFLLTYLLLPDKTRYHEDFTTPETYIPTALVAASLIFMAYDGFSRMAGTAPQAAFKDARGILLLICSLLALLSVAYFFLNSFIKDLRSDVRATASFIAIIFLCLYPTYLYFNKTLPINSPVKIADQMAYLSASIFFLYESRISLGREKWRAYVSFGMIAALLCAYSSIPSLVVYFRTGQVISNSIAESVLTFALFIFIIARLLLLRELKPEAKCELALAVEKQFGLRQSELGEDLLELARRNEPTQLKLDFEWSDTKSNAEDETEEISPTLIEAPEQPDDNEKPVDDSSEAVADSESEEKFDLFTENDGEEADITELTIKDLFDVIDEDASVTDEADSETIIPDHNDLNAEGDDIE